MDDEKKKIIEEDIKIIEDALNSSDDEIIKNAHRYIDGKYQACIKNWMMGMYGFDLEHGFAYRTSSIETMRSNLEIMKPKLLSFMEGWNENNIDSSKKTDVNLVVNNSINISISFEEARSEIEEMPGLSQNDTEIIQDKIDELERINQENISKKQKWEKVKPIIKFAIDKGADVAIVVLGLIMQMKLGMK